MLSAILLFLQEPCQSSTRLEGPIQAVKRSYKKERNAKGRVLELPRSYSVGISMTWDPLEDVIWGLARTTKTHKREAKPTNCKPHRPPPPAKHRWKRLRSTGSWLHCWAQIPHQMGPPLARRLAAQPFGAAPPPGDSSLYAGYYL